jgi:ribosomal protein S12 methylthiotransferase
MSLTVSMISLGCSKNLIDSEIMLGILKEKGYILIDNPEKADVIVINTCGFINDAKEESIDTIVEVGEYKKHGNCKFLIVTGCLSERYKDELLKELPEIDALVGTSNIDRIDEAIESVIEDKKYIKVGDVDKSYSENLPRLLTTPPHTAYVKIAEGCDNYCTYCIIPQLRGKYRSRKIESIIEEVKSLASKGVKEIILIAQDTTKYGVDLYGEYRLPLLLDELEKIEGIKWIRILYSYPNTLSDDLIDSIKRNKKVVNYIDMPIQHISDKILKRMNRKIKKSEIIDIIDKLRTTIPDVIIRTTLIVGFPGETDSDFNELYNFVKDEEFDRLGVFMYSREEGTAAYNLKDQIDENIKIERHRKIMELQKEISFKRNRNKIGNVYDVIIEEKAEDNLYIGRTYMDSPEIDAIVYVKSETKVKIGEFVKVKISDCLEYDLLGEIINESSK